MFFRAIKLAVIRLIGEPSNKSIKLQRVRA